MCEPIRAVRCVRCRVRTRQWTESEGECYCPECARHLGWEPDLTPEQCDALDAEYAAIVDALE
jgi:hypothetical protein